MKPTDRQAYAGNGTIKCGVCKESLVDHEMRPCPQLGVDIIHASTRQPRKRKGTT